MLSRIFVLFFFCFCFLGLSAHSETLKQHLDLTTLDGSVLPNKTQFYLSKLREATSSVIDRMQEEINANNKDVQLSTRLYMKRIDSNFYSTPQGKIYKKYPIDTDSLVDTAQVLDLYMQAVWVTTEQLQRRMALEPDGTINLKLAIPPIVVQQILKTYSTDDYSGRLLSLQTARSDKNRPLSDESEIVHRITYDRSPLSKFTVLKDNNFTYYSVLNAKMSCLQCHGEPKGKDDPYFFKKEGYTYNQKIGAVVFTFKTIDKKVEEDKN